MSFERGYANDHSELAEATDRARKREIDLATFNELHPDLVGMTEDDVIEAHDEMLNDTKL